MVTALAELPTKITRKKLRAKYPDRENGDRSNYVRIQNLFRKETRVCR